MATKKLSATEYMERHDGEMQVILGEKAEYAVDILALWDAAREVVRTDPDESFRRMIDAEMYPSIHIKNERIDSLRRARGVFRLLDQEIPDVDDEEESGPAEG